MKLKPFLKGASIFIAILVGVSLFVVGDIYGTGFTYREPGQFFGWRQSNEASDVSLYYLPGSTTVALTLYESSQTNYDWIDIMFESASDVWVKQATGITLKDSDSDGYVDWLGFTATGGATAGGEVRIRGVAIDKGDIPHI